MGKRLSAARDVSIRDAAHGMARADAACDLCECFERLRVERREPVGLARANLVGPIGIGDQRASHGNKIEIAPVEHLEQALNSRSLRAFLPIRLDEVLAEADRAHRDRGYSRELFGPAGEIEV